MSPKSKKNFLFLGSTILWACVVHAFFIYKLGGGGSQGDWQSVVFYPHIILMYILPPRSYDDVISWKLAAETISAFPASLLYGAVITLILNYLLNKLHKIRNRKDGNP
jgi:hypothetical protein